jgi:predicted DNA-binding transcriptional regulator AlpA
MKNKEKGAAIREEVGAKLLLSAAESARALGISRSSFYALHSSGQVGPLPVRLGGRVLWRQAELADWVSANCPPRSQWLGLKQNGR